MMPSFKYVIRLKSIHEKTGLTPYAVAKQCGVTENTVRKYMQFDAVEVKQIRTSLAVLCDFYGVDFHDAVEVVPVDR